MHPAHLDALLGVLESDKFPRPNLPRVYRHLHGISRGGVLPCSMNAILRDLPGRPALTGISDTTLDKLVWLLRNLQLLKLDAAESPISRMPEPLWRLAELPELNSRELVFGLERMVDKPPRVCRAFCAALEAPAPGAKWLEVRHFFAGERLTTDDLVSEAFRSSSLEIKSLATLAKVLQELGQGGVNSLATPLAKQLPGSQDLGHPPSEGGCIVTASSECEVDTAGMVPGGEEENTMGKKTLDELLSEGTKALQKGATKYKPGTKAESARLKNRNGKGINNGPAKTVTSRLQNLRSWEQWRTTRPVLDEIFPAPAIVLNEAGDPDLEKSNPDALKLIEMLQKSCSDLLEHKICPNDIPALLLKAWIAYAHLFNLKYARPGDLRMIPFLRVAFRRMVSGQSLLTRGEVLTKMAGLAFRMDGLRRNRKGAFFPNREWIAIYDPKSKYAEAWEDAQLSMPEFKGKPFSYMLSVEPFVKPTNPDGSELEPMPKSPAERLTEIYGMIEEGHSGQLFIYDMRHGTGSWDKLSRGERAERILDTETLDEMRRLEKELAGDTPDGAVPQP